MTVIPETWMYTKVDIYVFITPIQGKNNENSSSFEFKHQNRAQ